MGNLWSWFCRNSSSKEVTQENEGSYRKTENGTAEKVTSKDTIEIALESPKEVKIVESSDSIEPVHKALDVDSLDDTPEQVQQDKIHDNGDEKILMCTSQDVSMNGSFCIDDRLPTFVTVPSPTQVKKLQASVRA